MKRVTITVREFDEQGRVVRETVTEEDFPQYMQPVTATTAPVPWTSPYRVLSIK